MVKINNYIIWNFNCRKHFLTLVHICGVKMITWIALICIHSKSLTSSLYSMLQERQCVAPAKPLNDRWTDRWFTTWSLCGPFLRRWHKNELYTYSFPLAIFHIFFGFSLRSRWFLAIKFLPIFLHNHPSILKCLVSLLHLENQIFLFINCFPLFIQSRVFNQLNRKAIPSIALVLL